MKFLGVRLIQLFLALTLSIIGVFISIKISSCTMIQNLETAESNEYNQLGLPMKRINAKVFCASLATTVIITIISVYGVELGKYKIQSFIDSLTKNQSILPFNTSLGVDKNSDQTILVIPKPDNLYAVSASKSGMNFKNLNSNIDDNLGIHKNFENKDFQIEFSLSTPSSIPSTEHVTTVQSTTIQYDRLEKLIIDRDNCNILSDINSLPNIKELSILGVELKDLSILHKFQQIESLTAMFNNLESIQGIEVCKQLKHLKLDNNKIVDLRPISSLVNLGSLSLKNNQIISITPISDLKNLVSLIIDMNPISNISAIQNLTDLGYLSMSDTDIFNLSSLKKLKNVYFLNIGNTKIKSLSPIVRNIDLISLDISGTPIKDISEVLPFKNLMELNISRSKIFNLSGIKGCIKLKKLVAEQCSISDLSPLSELESLNELYLSHNQIENLAPLKYLFNLSTLDLSFNNLITNIDSLREIKYLKEINLLSTGLDPSSLSGFNGNIDFKLTNF